MMLKPDSNIKHFRLFLKEYIGKTFSSSEADAIIQIIFKHFGLNYLDSFTETERALNPEIIPQINEIVKEITNNRPIQYILGYTFFSELKINVDENVLIPRQETEELVDLVIKHTSNERIKVLDIGTGSGCIAIAIKKHFPQSSVVAMDKYPETLKMARKNADLNRTGIGFLQADILEDPADAIDGRFDLIISNPPYVTLSEKAWMEPNVLEHEPANALFVDDSDPFLFFRAIAGFALKKLNTPGDIWVEINERFGKETGDIFKEKGFGDIRILRDIHGKDRFIHAKAI